MNKILQISIDDIIINPSEQSDMITRACRHSGGMVVTGLVQVGERILITMEPNKTENEYSYILAPFNSENIDDITAEISTRYFSGFSLLGGFELKSSKWALFAKENIITENS